ASFLPLHRCHHLRAADRAVRVDRLMVRYTAVFIYPALDLLTNFYAHNATTAAPFSDDFTSGRRHDASHPRQVRGMLGQLGQKRLGPLEILRLHRVVPVRFFCCSAVDRGEVFGQVGGKGHPKCLLTASTTRLRQWSQSW